MIITLVTQAPSVYHKESVCHNIVQVKSQIKCYDEFCLQQPTFAYVLMQQEHASEA